MTSHTTSKVFHLNKPPPLSLYIHIPWCVRKCPYCDFNSHPIQGKIPENDYIAALLADLDQEAHFTWGRTIHSIFIGGGTPSVLSPDAIDRLLSGIRARLSIMEGAEITLEANPGTIDNSRFQGFHEAGINRLSLGIQSFNDSTLQHLGRIHGSIEAINAIEAAHKAGFHTINLDLMFGLPTQTIKTALEDLHQAVAFQPAHLSWYQLTIEPNTLFYHHSPSLPDEDLLWEMQTAGQKYLAEQGYLQYEISAYAFAMQQCQHNLNYWKFGDYLGIGAGAHGKISDAKLGTITRLSKQCHPDIYLQRATTSVVIAHEVKLTPPEVVLEFMMNALRLIEGFTEQELLENTGISMARVEKPIQEACSRGWLFKDKDEKGMSRIRVTETGMRFLNEVLGLFVP